VQRHRRPLHQADPAGIRGRNQHIMAALAEPHEIRPLPPQRRHRRVRGQPGRRVNHVHHFAAAWSPNNAYTRPLGGHAAAISARHANAAQTATTSTSTLAAQAKRSGSRDGVWAGCAASLSIADCRATDQVAVCPAAGSTRSSGRASTSAAPAGVAVGVHSSPHLAHRTIRPAGIRESGTS
jgi:hypothetical protein